MPRCCCSPAAAGPYGVWLTGRALLTPAPQCAGGALQIDGSTAFAPIAKQVATEYEQDCQGYQPEITVNAVGSVAGLAAPDERRRASDHRHVRRQAGLRARLALPAARGRLGHLRGRGQRQFAPGERLPLSGTGNGLSDSEIEEAFNQAESEWAAVRTGRAVLCVRHPGDVRRHIPRWRRHVGDLGAHVPGQRCRAGRGPRLGVPRTDDHATARGGEHHVERHRLCRGRRAAVLPGRRRDHDQRVRTDAGQHPEP